MAFDPVRGRALLFDSSDTYDSSIYEFDSVRRTWSPVATVGAMSSRTGCAVAFDAARGRLVVFGGASGFFTEFDETWEYEPATASWQQIATVGAPSARHHSLMAYDPTRGRVVLFGGVTGSGFFGARTFHNDTWEFDGATATWSPISTSTTPPLLDGAAMAYDAQRQVITLHGGSDPSTLDSLNRTWEFDGTASTWTDVTPPSGAPVRSFHSMVFDSVRNRTILFGGVITVSNWPNQPTRTYPVDTWEWDGAARAWTSLAIAPGPQSRTSFAMAYDPAAGSSVLFGGDHPNVSLRDTWTLPSSGPIWRSTYVSTPQWRQGHATAFAMGGNRMVLFGGLSTNYTQLFNDTWELEFATRRWRSISTSARPAGRWEHAMSYDSRRDRIVLFGGGNSNTGVPFGDTWTYDLRSSTWTQIATPAGAPPARSSHTLVYDPVRDRHILFGGEDPNLASFGDTWEFDLGTSSWTQLSPSTSPSARIQHEMVYDSSRGVSILYGGQDFVTGTTPGDTWEFDSATASWNRRVTTAVPTMRSVHGMAFDALRGRTILAGGRDEFGSVSSETWEFDGVAGTWALVPTQFGNHAALNGTVSMAFDNQSGRVIRVESIHYGFMDTLWFDPPAVPTWTTYGTGCAGSTGTPHLDALGASLPQLGGSFAVQLTNLPPQPGIVHLLLGLGIATWNTLPLPVDLAPAGLPGCLIWLDPLIGSPIAYSGTTATWTLAIPAQPALAGFALPMQAIVVDPLVGNGIGSLTNAGIAVLH